jgi:2-methylcitrate dehydratase PrpD
MDSRRSGKVTSLQERVMSQVEQIAEFGHGADFEALGSDTRQQLKIRILDSLGCSLGALHAEPIRMIRAYINELGSKGSCTLIGGGCADVDRAALYNLNYAEPPGLSSEAVVATLTSTSATY